MIVGLGNPGRQYAHTRHNVGFDVIDRFAKRRGVHVRSRRHRALLGTLVQDGREILLVKPQTYMNNSGTAVAALAREHGVQPSEIIVVYDDIDLPLGRLRVRAKGSSGGHKGVESIIQSLGSSEFPRVRIGIGRSGDAIDHVLSRFTRQEKKLIDPVIERAAEALDVMISEGLEAAMNIYNRKENDL